MIAACLMKYTTTLCICLHVKTCTQQCKNSKIPDRRMSEAVLGPHIMLLVNACAFLTACFNWKVQNVAIQPLRKYLNSLSGCPVT